MQLVVKINRMLLRLVFLVLLVLGVALWLGHANLRPAHIGLGFCFALLVLLQGLLGLATRAGWQLSLLAVVWALCLPAVGLGQLQWMPGDMHWVIRVVHLLVGLLAMPIVETIGKRALATK